MQPNLSHRDTSGFVRLRPPKTEPVTRSRPQTAYKSTTPARKPNTAPIEAFNKGQPYSDDEIRLILSLTPTAENAAKIAIVLGREPKAIELVYRKAMESQKDLLEHHPSSEPGVPRGFIEPLIRIRKELGWLA